MTSTTDDRWGDDLDWWHERLEAVRASGTRLKARCPAHEDRSPSLSVELKGDRVVWHCHAGCSQDEVLDAARGHSSPPRATRATTRMPTAKPTAKAKGHERRPAYDHAGELVAHQVGGRWDPAGVKPADLHGGLASLDGVDADEWVVLVEGHGPAIALAGLGIPAVATVTGKGGTISELGASFLAGRRVILWPDSGGEDHMERCGHVLQGVAAEIRMTPSWAKGVEDNLDAADVLEANGPEDVLSWLEAAEPWRPVPRFDPIPVSVLLEDPPESPDPIVDGLILAGVTGLVAAPKIGKSWLCYQLMHAISHGLPVLGRRTRRSGVLYLALEDGKARATTRYLSIDRRHPETRSPAFSSFLFSTAVTGQELVDELEDYLERVPGVGFVMIDTLEKVRPRSTGRRGQYEVDVEDIGRLVSLTQRRPGLGVLVVHHDRKMKSDDPMDMVSGTHGITGTWDTTLYLSRARRSEAATMDVIARDLGDDRLDLRYVNALRDPDEDPDVDLDRELRSDLFKGARRQEELMDRMPYWAIDPDGTGRARGRTAEAIKAMRTMVGPMSASELGTLLGMDRTNAQHLLGKLVSDGYAEKVSRGRYRLIQG